LLSGRYRLDAQLASGGMAQVWRGTDEVLRRSVAVKILHPHLAADDTFVARFRQEAIAVARLSHPAIVSVYDTCSVDGTEAIVMELVRGQTLRQRLDNGAIGPWVAANIAAQVAGALDVAHTAGLVHRDIKPANIMLSDDGRVKVGDFGIAKAAESADLTEAGSYIGTAKYLAPEQVEGGPVDGRCDLYSLGVVLFEMLCGRVPFEADNPSATALARLHQEPQRPRLVRPGVPRELEAVTMRLLARRPDDRYSTATEARGALLNAGAEESTVSGEVASVAPLVPGVPPGPPAPPGPSGPPTHGLGMGSPYGPPSAPPSDQTQVRFARNERRWLVPVLLIVLAMVSLGVAGLLLGGSGAGDLFDGAAEGEEQEEDVAAEALAISSATAFDPPPGDGSEHDDEIDRVIDGQSGSDRESVWDTEWYHTANLGGLKPGVGFYLTLENEAAITELAIESPSEGWNVEIYIAPGPADDITGWGEAVAAIDGGEPGVNRVELDEEVRGGAVLVWFTFLSPQPDDPRFRVDVAEVQVLGR
jgi:eukaryotic-like serine/threonine-protein kinase